MMKLHVIYVLSMLFLIYSCTKDEEPESEPEVYQIQTATFTDERDGTAYRTVKIGEQWWMAENLAYETESGSYAYEDDENNVQKYGRLYTLDAAIKACPNGWHLPTENEWRQMATYICNEHDEKIAGDHSFHICKYLKSITGWYEHGTVGIDYYGFNGLPGGGYFSYSLSFGRIGEEAYWWQSTVYSNPYNFNNYYYWNLDWSYEWLKYTNHLHIDPNDGYSVRCVKD